MEKIVEVKPKNDYSVFIRFADGFSAIIDISPFIRGGISDQLKDITYFNEVFIDQFNGISWANGFDFCPNFLREYVGKQEKA
ncbi:MAG: DUF2442 domain-containing protein [Bacteroidota bacterium]